MFSNVSLDHRAYGITTYARALALYEGTKPIRGRAVEVRPLGSNRRDTVTITKHPVDASISIEHYRTKLITYHVPTPPSPAVITVNPYPSKTSSNIVAGVLREFISPSWARPIPGPVTYLIDRGFYHTPHEFRLETDADGNTALWGCEPVVEQRLDRKRAAEVQRLMKPFVQWVWACQKLGVLPKGEWAYNPPFRALVAAMSEQQQWPEVVKTWPSYYTLDSQLSTLRRNLYYELNCYDVLHHDGPFTYQELDRLAAAGRRYNG